MGELHKILRAEIRKVPGMFLRQLVIEKFEAATVDYDDKLVSMIVESLLNGDATQFELPSSGSQSITLSFGDNDIADLEHMAKGLMDQMPDMISDMSVSAAHNLLRSYKKSWRNYRPHEEAIFQQFRDNLNERWSKGLNDLRLLLAISRDVGETYYKRLRRSKAKKGLLARDVLGRLHTRACQVTAEIITLLENGYADGAMSRWRTLYEISVVGTLIAKNGDDLAERYIEHEAIESKRAMDEFVRNHADLGYAPPSKREIAAVTKRCNAAVNKFGTAFGTPYGWAIGYIGINNPNPKFVHLEDAAGRAMMRSHYKMASYNIHASPKGITFRLGTIDDPNMLIAGATNAGLEEPGQNTAITLTTLTSYLMGPRHSLDNLVQMRILMLLRDQAVSGFIRAGRKLRRDELVIRNL